MRCKPMRDMPMRWPMRDARLWETRLLDGLCEKHAYERHAYEMAAYERHAYEMAPVRNTSVRDAPVRDTPIRDIPMGWSIRDARL
jgi:hypothetical protein